MGETDRHPSIASFREPNARLEEPRLSVELVAIATFLGIFRIFFSSSVFQQSLSFSSLN